MTISTTDLPSSPEDQQQQQKEVQPKDDDDSDDDDDRTTKLIQTYFIHWRERLQKCEKNYSDNLNEESDTPNDDNNKDNNRRWRKQYKVYTDYHLEIYQIKQQLHQLRQLLHYGNNHQNENQKNLAVTGIHYKSMINDIIPSNHELTHIDFLESTSIQTLQDEFMKCQDMLEKINVSSCTNSSSRRDTYSNGSSNLPFLFYKYRLQSTTRNEPPPYGTVPMTTSELHTTMCPIVTTTTTTKGIDPMSSSMIIENLTNRTIIIDKDGNVQQRLRDDSDIICRPPQSLSDPAANMKNDIVSVKDGFRIAKQKIDHQSMVIRNLHNCVIQM